MVSWKTLLIVFASGLSLAAMLNRPEDVSFLFIIVSSIIKVVAGGKRRAELTATQATQRAETEQLERTVLEARMEALQAQIEPHFLFNTLGSIDQLIRPIRRARRGCRRVSSATCAPRCRRCATAAARRWVSRSTFRSAFLEIMAVRMEERLEAVINVPEGLKSAVFPSMMLQTLVENAIKHGLEPKGAEAAGSRSAPKSSMASWPCTLIDNGMGFTPKCDDGVGLANIRERLRPCTMDARS